MTNGTTWTLGPPPRSVQYWEHGGTEWVLTCTWDRDRTRTLSVQVLGAGGEPVTASILKAVPLRRLQTEALADFEGFYADVARIARGSTAAPHRGTRTSDAELAATAEVYRRAWLERRSVTEAVMAAFGLSSSMALKRVMKARAAGLLDGVGPGFTRTEEET